ncbi:exodeoxyribonuclease V subunit alpha [Gephyromycinifex aptenodytis]|uniref:exodeoxyribonuclease V subunit alpha n=1 Tax=Gephyromycinifex aptenodytis TaxID=2716227 RepID=UPI001B2FFF04|nr:exodeoxyribonuclease V subunit alpha [Gephyromycinifex aptenodytis]
MSELFEATSENDARLALRAQGLLAHANQAGLVTAPDVHVADRLGVLTGEDRPEVLLAVALLSRAARAGSTCLDVRSVAELTPEVAWPEGAGWPDPQAWSQACQSGPLIEAGVLRHEFGLLYLDRYWQEERQVCADLQLRLSQPPPQVDEDRLASALERLFPGQSFAEQRQASQRAARSWTTVLTGGPGSGKTTTVARLLALLADQADGAPLRIALSAPTGKAAARLQEAVLNAAGHLTGPDAARLEQLQASTLHRLLGWRPGHRTRFAHDRSNPLPHDIVVVDETSMLSLTMTARLLEALRPQARLILVGDADQLASVDAGAVLADLVAGLSGRADSPVVTLRGSHRFDAGIRTLADAIRDGDADALLAALRSSGPERELIEDEDPLPRLRARLVRHACAIRDAARDGRGEEALELVGRHRLLCAHRRGPFGVQAWNRHIERWVTEETGDRLFEPMYLGRPLLVTANDYGLELFNGDTGVVVRGEDGSPVAWMSGASGSARLGASRLGDVETMHAMTVHKAQGSEAQDVTVLLPTDDSALLTRELLYTAITRAQRRVCVVGSEAVLRESLTRRARRATGLAERLATGDDSAAQ